MKPRAAILALAALPLLASFVPQDEGPFAKLTLAEALAKAGEAKKVVMVDFFTTWCPPCKRLDAETWTDAGVRGWLATHAVALKLDAGKEKEAAAKHKIRAYPTMLFLKPDGTELGRMVGFRGPEAFLSEAAGLLVGRTRLDSLRAQLEGAGGNDPKLRKDLGKELVELGRYEEALEHFLWAWDHGRGHSGFGGVRGSFLLSEIRSLGARHPPALEALRRRRDACETALLGGDVTYELTSDLANLNDKLGEAEGTLRVYDALKARQDLDEGARSDIRIGMFDEVVDLLLKAGRYQEVLDGVGDYSAEVDERMNLEHLTMSMVEDDPNLANMMKYMAVDDCAKYYEALLGTGQKEAARALAERLVAYDPREGTYKVLRKRAEAAKATDEAAAWRKLEDDARQARRDRARAERR